MSNSEATYIANHFYFAGWFAIPETDADHYALFFLHQMYECIEKEYPDCLEEFTAKCKELNMKPYIDEYLTDNEENKKQNTDVIGSAFEQVIKLLDKMNADERTDVFAEYCTYCGDKNPRCQCWNDE
jgi:hypothetical protein